VPPRLSATERIRAQIDELFASQQDLGQVLEEVARLSVRLVMQAALEAEICEFLGRDRYARGKRERAGYRNGHAELSVKTAAGPVVLERPKLRGTASRSPHGGRFRAAPPRHPRPGRRIGPAGLVAGECGFGQRAGQTRGDHVGASPVDRGLPGSKSHLPVERGVEGRRSPTLRPLWRTGGRLPLPVVVEGAPGACW
jgi:hypothetical protein